jgi:transposase
LFDASSHEASLHRSADCILNSIRAHLAEVGIVAPVGRNGIEQSLEVVADAKDTRLPEIARACVTALGTQLLAPKAQIPAFDRRIMAWHRSSETSKRLDEIPRVGPALATALAASIADPKAFRSGRDFSAWIATVPDRTRSACGAGRVDTKNTAIAGQQQQNPQNR